MHVNTHMWRPTSRESEPTCGAGCVRVRGGVVDCRGRARARRCCGLQGACRDDGTLEHAYGRTGGVSASPSSAAPVAGCWHRREWLPCGFPSCRIGLVLAPGSARARCGPWRAPCLGGTEGTLPWACAQRRAPRSTRTPTHTYNTRACIPELTYIKNSISYATRVFLMIWNRWPCVYCICVEGRTAPPPFPRPPGP